MDDNFIKDSRVFPEEMNRSSFPYESSFQQQPKSGKHIVLWIVVLLVVFGLVFLAGWFLGTKKAPQENKSDQEILQQEREQELSRVDRSNQELSPQERSERLHAFFGEE